MPPPRRYRWRRLARDRNKLLLYRDMQRLFTSACVEEVPNEKTIELVTDTVYIQATGLPPGETAELRVGHTYYSHDAPIWGSVEYVTVQGRVFFKDAQTQEYSASPEFVRLFPEASPDSKNWAIVEVECTRVFERDGGTFPVTGTPLGAIHEESKARVIFYAQRESSKFHTNFICVPGFFENDVPINYDPTEGSVYRSLNGEIISRNEYYRRYVFASGGSITSLEWAERDGGYHLEPVDDADFVSATK